MKTKPTTKPGAIEANVRAFENDFANADSVRASALSGLQRLRAAKANHAEREQMRLAAKLGEDHPDVVRSKAEVAGDRRFGLELGAEVDRAATDPPVVDERGWALHGFVRDQELQGQANLTVALFDRAQRWIEPLGHACTDRRGYFQLRFSSDKKRAAGEDSKAASDATQQQLEVFVHVTNRKQELLYRDKKPMIAVLGEVKYREIILGDESASCQPPSDASSERPGEKPSTEKPANEKPAGEKPSEKPPSEKPPGKKPPSKRPPGKKTKSSVVAPKPRTA